MGFAAYWRWKSRPHGGRPRIGKEVRELIRRMSFENSLWGTNVYAIVWPRTGKSGFWCATYSHFASLDRFHHFHHSRWRNRRCSVPRPCSPTTAMSSVHARLAAQHGLEALFHQLLAHPLTRAWMIWLSLHPSPASETSAFNKIRAFSRRCAGLLPFPIIISSSERSPQLNRTTYFFTTISFAAMIASASSALTSPPD